MKKDKNGKEEISYPDLLLYINNYIRSQYTTVTAFLNSPDFVKCGFNEREKYNVANYLAIPTDWSKVTKSIPCMKKLYKGLLNTELDVTVRTYRETISFLPFPLKELEKRMQKNQ